MIVRRAEVVRANGEHVVKLSRGSGAADDEFTILTFTEVYMAAEVLRSHLLSLTPPEIPALAAEKSP